MDKYDDGVVGKFDSCSLFTLFYLAQRYEFVFIYTIFYRTFYPNHYK